jgi:HAD superfamily hydrolase (TIGR01509 family)
MHGPELKTLLERAGMLSYFDERLVIASTDAAARKPSPVTYKYAANRAGVSIDQCVYIGDEDDQVNGAIAAGMTGVLNPVP